MSITTSNHRHRALYAEAVQFEGHVGPVFTCRFNSGGDILATGGADRQILLWRVPRDEKDQQPNYGVIEGHKGAVTCLDFISEGKLFSGASDSNVAIWDMENGQKLRNEKAHTDCVNDCSVSGHLAVSVSDDGTARVWDERQRGEVLKVSSDYPLLSCCMDSGRFYIGGIDPTVRCYDLRTGTETWRAEGLSDSVSSLFLSNDGSTLVARTMAGEVRTVRAADKVPAGVPRLSQSGYTGISAGQSVLTRALFSHDDVFVALGSDDGALVIWTTAGRRMVNMFHVHNKPVTDVSFHPCEKLVMSASMDGSVIVREY